MKFFITKRLIAYNALALFLVALFILLDLKYRYGEEDHTWIILLDLALFGTPFLFLKSNWFISLPYSRKKLVLYHLIETVFIYGCGAILLSLTEYYFEYIRGHKDSFGPVHWVFALFFAAMYFSFPLNNQIYRYKSFFNPSAAFFKKQLTSLFCVIIIIIGIRLYGTEPFFLSCMFIVLICSAGSICYRVFEGPMKTLRIFIIASSLASVVLCSSLFLYLVLQFKYSKDPHTISEVSSLLSEIPVTVSEDQAKYIFSLALGSDEKVFQNAIATYKDQISYEDWLERTKRCEYSSCFDLSEKFFPTQGNENKKSEALYLMLRKCYFRLAKSGQTRCAGPTLSKKQLEPWLEEFASSTTINEWLSGPNFTKQIIAIKSLSKKILSERQKKRIQDLQNSENKLVRNAADFEISFYSKRMKAKDGICTTKPSDCVPNKISDLFRIPKEYADSY